MKRALFIGRFQPFHNAHLVVVKKILKEADEILMAIGSSQEKNTLENPFSFSERKNMISNALKKNGIKNFRIYGIPDKYDDRKWMGHIKRHLPKFENVYSGNPRVIGIFRLYGKNPRKIKLIKGVSSTIVKDMIIKNKNWKKLVPREIADSIMKIKGVERVKRIY